MTLQMENLGSIFEAYSSYLKSCKPDDRHCDANIKTALIRYTLPGWGIEVKKGDNIIELMQQVTLHQFKDALSVQEGVFDSMDNLSGAVKRNYRMHLSRMLNWCATQRWWKQEYTETVAKYAPRIRLGYGNVKKVESKRKRKSYYNLKDEQLNENLIEELANFHRFLVSISFRKRQDDPVREVTAQEHIRHTKRMLGWLHNIKKKPLEQLSLKSLDDIDLIYDFTDWMRQERGVKPRTEFAMLESILAVAKFNHHKFSNVKQYRDIKIIEELRELLTAAKRRSNDNSLNPSDISHKWIEWSEFLAAVEKLKQECALRKNCGNLRSDTAIAGSYQKYLMGAFLAYMPPDRQRTFRELEINRTLIKENDKWFIKLGVDDYKTGKTYGEQIALIPDIIYPELEAWLNKWRLVFNPKHNFVFTKFNGEPMNEGSFYGMFTTFMYRITGKAVNPHLIRTIAITHFKKSGATDQEMESLALAMKHSREIQSQIYDKRTSLEKVAPALEMMLKQKSTALPKP